MDEVLSHHRAVRVLSSHERHNIEISTGNILMSETPGSHVTSRYAF